MMRVVIGVRCAVVLGAAAVWVWAPGWAGELAAGLLASWYLGAFRSARSVRAVAAAGAVVAAGLVVGDLAGGALRAGGDAGKTLAWLLPPGVYGAVMLARWAAAARAFRRDQPRVTISPGSWPGSR
jgi:hypothetical protein